MNRVAVRHLLGLLVVNRVAVRHLLGLLVERAATLPVSRGGGEWGGHADQAVAAVGEQDRAAAS